MAGYGANRQTPVAFLYTSYKQLENVIIRMSLFIIVKQHYTIPTMNPIKRYARQTLKNIKFFSESHSEGLES